MVSVKPGISPRAKILTLALCEQAPTGYGENANRNLASCARKAAPIR